MINNYNISFFENYNDFLINICNMQNNNITYILNKPEEINNLIEKTIYDIASYHLNKINKNISEVFVEFWFKKSAFPNPATQTAIEGIFYMASTGSDDKEKNFALYSDSNDATKIYSEYWDGAFQKFYFEYDRNFQKNLNANHLFQYNLVYLIDFEYIQYLHLIPYMFHIS